MAETKYLVRGELFSTAEEATAASVDSEFQPVKIQLKRVWDVVTEAGAQVVIGVSEDIAKAECDRLKNDIDGDPSVVFTLATREVQVD